MGIVLPHIIWAPSSRSSCCLLPQLPLCVPRPTQLSPTPRATTFPTPTALHSPTPQPRPLSSPTPPMPTLEAAATTLVVLSPVLPADKKKRRCQQNIKIDSWNHVLISPFMFTQRVCQNTEIEKGSIKKKK